MMRALSVVLTVAVLGLCGPAARSDRLPPQEREVLGWVEYVEFDTPRVRLKAKLDTGATTSSLNAMNLRRFRRGGKSWVRFDVLDPDRRGEHITFEAPVVRMARIRRHDGLFQERPVVYLDMCLGHVLLRRQFTLIDRSDFNYQVLVGRNFLRGYIVVDPAERLQTRPQCLWPETAPAEELSQAPAA
jgi:hypothetical protein